MPETLSLNGAWFLRGFPAGQSPTPEFLAGLDSPPAIQAQVPGNVELDLQRLGLLPEPFYAANIRLLQPYEQYEWWYVKKFTPPAEFKGQRSELVFDGLDTLATVWLNEQEIGRAANMLIPHRFEVTSALLPAQENTLIVRLASVMQAASRLSYEPGILSWENRPEGLRLRKAPHTWGWDILPRLVSAGIWRGVTLQTISEHAIAGLYCWTADASPAQASLGVWYQVRTTAPPESLNLRLTGQCGEHAFTFHWPLEFIVGQFDVPIPQPRLWWPVGYGAPNLYTLTVQLCQGEVVLAERVEQVGLRKLEIQRTDGPSLAWQSLPPAPLPARLDAPPTEASHFLFMVNGQPVMIKGTNWVPLDAFHSRDASRLAPALQMVADLGCNMLRCWGGGVYEPDEFFAWCDAHGVLVWQDFAFACCIYPQDDAFLAEVQAEVQAVAERLRNHASLALWCGDNEVDMVYASQGRSPQHNRLTRQAIPQSLQRFDPHRLYIPSSPYISPQALGGSASDTPEQHLWGPRGYFKADFYTRHTAHFIGEIGYHGCPAPDSVQKFISPENLWPPQDNEEWQLHSVYHWRARATQRDRIELMAKQVRALFGSAPDNLTDFALASQVTQAEAVKFFVESTRLRKWHTSGVLWWNLLDGWTQFSDAVVDYYFTKKLAYHYLWRVQRPLLLCLGESIPNLQGGLCLPVIISNDSLQDADVFYRVWEAGIPEMLAQGTFNSPANQNWQVAAIPLEGESPRLFLLEWQVGAQRFGNHYLLAVPPLDFARYRLWLPEIAALPRPFDAW